MKIPKETKNMVVAWKNVFNCLFYETFYSFKIELPF